MRILVGDVREKLFELPDGSVRCCVTSPPYFGLRDYGMAGQIGLEPTPEAFTQTMVEVFRDVRRVLADDGTLWLNLGDSYGGPKGNTRGENAGGGKERGERIFGRVQGKAYGVAKQLIGIPWRVAFALQSDGWYLRSDIIWHKPSPMPESVTDRPTKSHEHIFLLAKNARYFYDADAIAEKAVYSGIDGMDASGFKDARLYNGKHSDAEMFGSRKAALARGGRSRQFGSSTQEGTLRQDIGNTFTDTGTRNKRDVWTVSPSGFKGAHFATFPTALIEPCILAGSAKGDTVLDPFFGTGTTGLVADRLGRSCVGIELNPAYAQMAERRIYADAPLFSDVAMDEA